MWNWTWDHWVLRLILYPLGHQAHNVCLTTIWYKTTITIILNDRFIYKYFWQWSTDLSLCFFSFSGGYAHIATQIGETAKIFMQFNNKQGYLHLIERGVCVSIRLFWDIFLPFSYLWKELQALFLKPGHMVRALNVPTPLLLPMWLCGLLLVVLHSNQTLLPLLSFNMGVDGSKGVSLSRCEYTLTPQTPYPLTPILGYPIGREQVTWVWLLALVQWARFIILGAPMT